MTEKDLQKLYAESLNTKKDDKTVTGTVIQVSSKGEIFVDFKYKADGIIPKAEYSDDASKNPNDEFKPGDTITADVLNDEKKYNAQRNNMIQEYMDKGKAKNTKKVMTINVK